MPPEVDVYSRQSSGVKLCATLQPICDGSAELAAAPSVAIRQNSRSAVAIEVEFRTTAQAVEADHLRTGRRGGVCQDNGRRGRATAAGEGPLPVRRSARLLRRRHPGRCRGDPRGPGGASQRELPAAHDPRRKHDRDDGLGVARQRRRRHALGPRRRRGRSWPRTSPMGRSRAFGSRCWRTGGSGTSTALPWPTRTRRSAWSGRCRFPPCGASIGAPPTR